MNGAMQVFIADVKAVMKNDVAVMVIVGEEHELYVKIECKKYATSIVMCPIESGFVRHHKRYTGDVLETMCGMYKDRILAEIERQNE